MSVSRGMTRSVVVVAALCAAAACGKKSDDAGSGTSTQSGTVSAVPSSSGMSATASAGASGAASAPAASATGASADPSIASMTDENIAAELEGADKNEVVLARLVASKATDAAVKRYAEELISDHTKSEKEVASVAQKLKLAMKEPPSDTGKQALAHLEQRFRSMPKGAAFDTAFVNHEIEDHQHDLADAKAMQAQAKSPELKQLIDKTLPVLQKHLDDANKLKK